MRLWLIAIREELKKTQKEVAEAAEITQPSYHNIEKGERNPSVDTAKRIAAVLGFEWTRFYEDDDK